MTQEEALHKEQARSARRFAKEARDPEVKAIWLEIAVRFERLAEFAVSNQTLMPPSDRQTPAPPRRLQAAGIICWGIVEHGSTRGDAEWPFYALLGRRPLYHCARLLSGLPSYVPLHEQRSVTIEARDGFFAGERTSERARSERSRLSLTIRDRRD